MKMRWVGTTVAGSVVLGMTFALVSIAVGLWLKDGENGRAVSSGVVAGLVFGALQEVSRRAGWGRRRRTKDDVF